MNLPTNKLRDLIAVLQTFDPDVEVPFTAVVAVVAPNGKRCLVYDTAEPKFTEEDFLDKLTDAIDDTDITDDFTDIESTAREITRLYKCALKVEEIDELRDTIQDVASDLKHAANRLIDL